MTTEAITNYATMLKRGVTVIGEVVSIDPPEIEQAAAEATNHSSGGFDEYVGGGLTRSSEFTAMVNFTTSVMLASIWDSLYEGDLNVYNIEWPNGVGVSLNALVTKIKPQSSDATKPETLKAEITFRPSGELLWSGFTSGYVIGPS